jgi:hypothetical protein
VTAPSPHVLHRLAEQLGVEYLDLMRLAGYVVPETTGVGVISQASARRVSPRRRSGQSPRTSRSIAASAEARDRLCPDRWSQPARSRGSPISS